MAGAVHATTDWALAEVAVTDVGAAGTPVDGATPVEAEDATPVPAAFVAATVKV